MEQAAPEEINMEFLLSHMPPAPKLHVPIEDYERKYFPVSHQVHSYNDETLWRQDPRGVLEQIWAKCQDIVASPSKAVHEIRTSAPIPRKALLSYLVHRRTEKILLPPRRRSGLGSASASRDVDKPSPRPNDFFHVDRESGEHQIIRFYSSCICKGCLLQNLHRPYVLIYFPIVTAPDASALQRLLGMKPTEEIPHILTKKVKLDQITSYLTNFFIKVVKPHHAQCRPTVRGFELWTGIKQWIEYLKSYFDLLDLSRLEGTPIMPLVPAPDLDEDSPDDFGDAESDSIERKPKKRKRPRSDQIEHLGQGSVVDGNVLSANSIPARFSSSEPSETPHLLSIDGTGLQNQDSLFLSDISQVLAPTDSMGEAGSFAVSPFEFQPVHTRHDSNSSSFPF